MKKQNHKKGAFSKNDINPLKSKIFLNKALLAETAGSGNLFGDKLPLHLIGCISKQDGKSNKLGAYAILFESSGSDKSRSLGLSLVTTFSYEVYDNKVKVRIL